MEKTIKQQKNRYRLLQYSLFGAEYVSLATPYAVMAGINADEWFVYNPEPWKIGLGGSLGIALLALSVFLVTKKKENEKVTDGMIGLLIGWYAVTFIFYLLAHINMEIYTIMAYGGIGIAGAVGLNFGSKYFKKKADSKKQSIEDGQAELDKNQAIEEIKSEKTVKVRIKK